jgi:L-lactate dehydrogenase
METLTGFGVAFMTKRGMPEANAAYVSRIITETEAFRQSTHGIVQYKVIHNSLGKSIDPDAEPKVVRETDASVLLDSDRCLGNLAMKLARELAVKRARATGVGFVAVRNSQWVGALGMHLAAIAREGLLAQSWAQSNTCKDCAPIGGIDARFSTNPVALAFPTDGDPVLADFSTATMSMGGAGELIAKGERTTVPRFLDDAGRPTDDPSVIKRDGTVMFAGCETDGHKGYALSLFNEALTVLAGGSANNPELESHQTFALMVLDPDAFAGSEYYLREMKRYMEYLRSSRKREGFEAVRLPGERGFAALADCEANGVPLDEGKLKMLREIAEANGVQGVE